MEKYCSWTRELFTFHTVIFGSLGLSWTNVDLHMTNPTISASASIPIWNRKMNFLRVGMELISPEMLYLLLKCPNTKVNLSCIFPLEKIIGFRYPPSSHCGRILPSPGIWTMCFQQSLLRVKLIKITLNGTAAWLPCSGSPMQNH